MTTKAEVREGDGTRCAPGLEDGGRIHEPRNGVGRERDSPLEPAEGTKSAQAWTLTRMTRFLQSCRRARVCVCVCEATNVWSFVAAAIGNEHTFPQDGGKMNETLYTAAPGTAPAATVGRCTQGRPCFIAVLGIAAALTGGAPHLTLHQEPHRFQGPNACH